MKASMIGIFRPGRFLPSVWPIRTGREFRSVQEKKKSVFAIVDELQLSQPLVCHHLKELQRTLLVTVERSGPFVYYELPDDLILSLIGDLNETGEDLLKTRISF